MQCTLLISGLAYLFGPEIWPNQYYRVNLSDGRVPEQYYMLEVAEILRPAVPQNISH